MRLIRVVKNLIFCWAAVIVGHISKWVFKLPHVWIEYNTRPLFTIPKLVCIFSLTPILLIKYLGNPPARAAPEPRGPL